jgi:hypothetical protein
MRDSGAEQSSGGLLECAEESLMEFLGVGTMGS